MQILHSFSGAPQHYHGQIDSPDQDRPRQCPQCKANRPLTGHGFYTRTVIDSGFDGPIRIRRYLCESCRRTVSLLPRFVLPYLRFSLTIISVFLVARLLGKQTLNAAMPHPGPYQRGQSWIGRFRSRAEQLCAELGGLTPRPQAAGFLACAVQMLDTLGWIPAHGYLFGALRQHLLGWPRSLAPSGLRVSLSAAPSLA